MTLNMNKHSNISSLCPIFYKSPQQPASTNCADIGKKSYNLNGALQNTFWYLIVIGVNLAACGNFLNYLTKQQSDF